MGTIIKSVAVAKPLFRRKILPLTVQSVKKCLRNSGLDMEHIGLLVNTSVYSENHLREPALSSFILEKVQFCPFRRKSWRGNSEKIFSFDLHGGGGGVIAAFQLINGFLQSGEIKNGLVVAGDVKPVSGSSEYYNYTPGAAAVLLSNEAGDKGFECFSSYTFPEFISDLKSSINWDSGKFRFAIQQNAEFLNHCVSCAMTSIHHFFEEKNLRWEQVDLVITSHSPAGFNGLLKKVSGISDKMVDIGDNDNYYSAGLLFSLSKVFNTQRFSDAKNILFVTVGAGITVSISWYKN